LPKQAELKPCFRAIFSCLRLLHANGLAHRDLRWPNILKRGDDKGWMVIDFELAGEINSKVFWENDTLPSDVSQGHQVYTTTDDIIQVKKLLKSVPHPSTWNDFIDSLGRDILTADEALSGLNSLPDVI